MNTGIDNVETVQKDAGLDLLFLRTVDNKYICIRNIDYFFCRDIPGDPVDLIYPFGTPIVPTITPTVGIYAHVGNQDVLLKETTSPTDKNEMMKNFLTSYYLHINKERDPMDRIVWDLCVED